MKRFVPFLAILTLLWPAFSVTARGADVSINFFYDNLNGGNWYEVADYGYVWQPDAATDPSWRPYTDGYWAYTDQGWTWVSYEDFGWATYHYGRWSRLADYGWVWVPGYEWGPAWVSWRTGGDTIGWAPLPPPRPGLGSEVVYESRPITSRVDVDFDIGPAYYNFIDLRYIGEPVLRDRIYPYDRNVTYISNTVNVTNITYNNSTVYNYGPDFATVSRYSTRPIQRLTIQRESLDPAQAVRTGNVTKVQGDKLLLGAPARIQRPQSQTIAPPKVKSRIAQPHFETGWSNIKNPAEKAQIEQKIKTENPKNAAKPTYQPKAEGKAATTAPAANNRGAGATPPVAPSSSTERNGRGKRKGEKPQAQPGASVAPAESANVNPPGREQRSPEGNNNKRDRQDRSNRQERPENGRAGAVTPAPEANGNAVDRPAETNGKNRSENGKGNHNAQPERRESNAGDRNTGREEQARPGNENRRQEQQRVNARENPNAAARQTPNARQAGEQRQRAEQGDQPAAPARENVNRGRGTQEQAQPQHGGEGKGKKNKGNPSPTPAR